MRKIIIANWKMNPATPREARALAAKTKLLASRLRTTSLIVCPPAIHLGLLSAGKSKAIWGAQDVSLKSGEGPFTGELSAAMLRYAGAEFALIGHSERRAMGETDETVNLKVKNALAAKLKVILCVGEEMRDDGGAYLEPLREQIKTALRGMSRSDLKRLVIAYEPVWAVGKRALAADTPAEFFHHSLFIKKILTDLFDKRAAMLVPVLYGGSVDGKNAAGFLHEGRADGLLVGRASLQPEEFKKILYAAEH